MKLRLLYKKNIMKKQIFYSATIVLLAALSVTGCKKDSKTAKDYSPSFKNRTWTGEFNYANGIVQPFAMDFKENGDLTFNEVLGEFLGTWKLENGLLLVNLGTGLSFKAGITDDNKLTNIESPDASGRVLKNATLAPSADEALENTTWTYPNFTITFKTSTTANLAIGAGNPPPYLVTYVRKGKTIRFNASTVWFYFMVPSGTPSMKGANRFTFDPVIYPFVATRQ
jgi:hypothetical protein